MSHPGRLDRRANLTYPAPAASRAPGKLRIVVVHEGATYQALRDTGRAPPHSVDWICIASAGRDGVDAITPTIRGTFNPKASYKQLDIVAYNKGSFIARHDDPGPVSGRRLAIADKPRRARRKGPAGAAW
jgi:hypothetical protein